MKVNSDLFPDTRAAREEVREGVILLPDYCSTPALYQSLKKVLDQSPFRYMRTPGGRKMSVAITNCGPVGWVSDYTGYRYTSFDPLSRQSWPAMPDTFFELACESATIAGYPGFEPDCCLVNCYSPDARLGAHQDKDELCFDHPIVSVSMGMSAIFNLYGTQRGGQAQKIRLDDGDVLVFGGVARLAFHGVSRIFVSGKNDPVTMSDQRINLTFRRAL